MFLGSSPFWWDIGHSCTWISYVLAFLKWFSQRICVPKQHKEYMITEIEHWQYHQQYNIGKFYMCLWTLDYDDWYINSQQWKTLRECGVNAVVYIPLGTVLKELCCSLTCEFESSSTDGAIFFFVKMLQNAAEVVFVFLYLRMCVRNTKMFIPSTDCSIATCSNVQWCLMFTLNVWKIMGLICFPLVFDAVDYCAQWEHIQNAWNFITGRSYSVYWGSLTVSKDKCNLFAAALITSDMKLLI